VINNNETWASVAQVEKAEESSAESFASSLFFVCLGRFTFASHTEFLFTDDQDGNN